MLDALKEVGIDLLIGIVVVPLYLLYGYIAWKCINEWDWTKKIARMENKCVPALFFLLVATLPLWVLLLFHMLVKAISL